MTYAKTTLAEQSRKQGRPIVPAECRLYKRGRICSYNRKCKICQFWAGKK